MKGRMPEFSEGSDDGSLKVTVTVTEIRVNEPAE